MKRTGNARHIWTEDEVTEYYRKLGRRAPRVFLAPAPAAAPVEPKERRGRMNKTESDYAADILEPRKAAGEITDYRFEEVKLRLARGAWFTIDYFVFCSDGSLEAHEVKGHWREAARVRIKVAAEKYPFRFIAARKRRKKEGGGWQFERF